MEENIFPQPAVAEFMEGLIEARLHNDGEAKEAVKSLQDKMTGSFATPIYLLLDPQSGQQLDRRDGALLDEQAFAEWLKLGLSKSAN
ncbi:MAG: hypothetical protein QF524_04515 [Planctomycetota bacterium]|jgi:hypothetical protein|nr:hypothetical protein [Planctomycetota bacterium]